LKEKAASDGATGGGETQTETTRPNPDGSGEQPKRAAHTGPTRPKRDRPGEQQAGKPDRTKTGRTNTPRRTNQTTGHKPNPNPTGRKPEPPHTTPPNEPPTLIFLCVFLQPFSTPFYPILYQLLFGMSSIIFKAK